MRVKISHIIFFLFICVLAVTFYFFKRSTFSKEVLKIEILGPEKAGIGENVEYIVKYKNNGKVRIENATLYFECPEFSLVEEGKKEREEVNIGDIYPGQEKTSFFKCILFGKENEKRVAKSQITFNVKNLKALFKVETTFTTILKPLPLTFEFDLPSRVESGKEFKIYLNYFSHNPTSLSSLKIQLITPQDFIADKFFPSPTIDQEWEIPLINQGEGGKITVSGKIIGEPGQQKIFKASLFLRVKDEFLLLKEIFQKIEISKSTLFIRQEINGNPNYVAKAGDLLHFKIYFKNIGDKALEKLTLISQLEGEILDLSSIKAPTGFNQPGDNSIVFDWKQNPTLAILEPMAEGEIEFWVKLKENVSSKNPYIKHSIFLGPVKEEFLTKIQSKVEVSQKGFYQDEIFGNSGPLPPEVEKETTYTILWRIKNFSNDLHNVKMKSKLGENVKLVAEKFFPEEEINKFSFDNQTKELFFSIGDLPAGAEKAIAFQISFLPSQSQRGQIPVLIYEIVLEGEDVFTQSQIVEKGNFLDTMLKEGESLPEEKAKVR